MMGAGVQSLHNRYVKSKVSSGQVCIDPEGFIRVCPPPIVLFPNKNRHILNYFHSKHFMDTTHFNSSRIDPGDWRHGLSSRVPA
jgi:hypothetical protein